MKFQHLGVFVVSFALSFLIASCSTPEKKLSAPPDERKVQPALSAITGNPSGAKSERKYSNDCKTWVDVESFKSQIASATPKPRYNYMQLTTSDSSMKDEPRLVQYDTKDRVMVGDNMTFTSQVIEVAKTKVKSHNPPVEKARVLVRTFAHNIDSFSVLSTVVDEDKLESLPEYYIFPSNRGTWMLSMATDVKKPATLSYFFSSDAADQKDPRHLASRFSTLVCSNARCLLTKRAGVDSNNNPRFEVLTLTKDSLELAEFKGLEGFDRRMMMDVDQMCTASTKSQFVKHLQRQRDEYARSCKVILSDDAVIRKWTDLCRAFRDEIKPAARQLF